ncbi:hypothetical protein QEH56_07695 [Pelagicoccus enzymogenes]|uniref:hypothetical protein n=1 Tax=Pelagicoccus enzymogenes TaxID=2773457 RepID=UPI00280CB2BB|nr:hypothetical protein [Pelagicoccus enzymogenes]MDQ8198025.1 hypothetical protein [Pelagicoccus enzymogenes]
MKRFWIKLLVGVSVFQCMAFSANPDFEGRWRLDRERSSALDGWTAMDLEIAIDGAEVEVTHDMRWRSTRVVESNLLDTTRAKEIDGFFRIEQRHMAVYAPKQGVSSVQAAWLDEGNTLRVEALSPVEISQGTATIRSYYEYRVGEGGETLTLIELRSSRNNPLVYRFKKLPANDSSRP